jgi:hypothetical protein
MASRRFDTQPDDFGFLIRGADDAAVCSGRPSTCAVIDDAVVYAKMVGVDGLATLVQKLAEPFPGTAGTARLAPQGKLPPLFRALIAIQQAPGLKGGPLTLKELAFIIEANNDNRDREDDYYLTLLLMRALFAPNTLTAAERLWVASRQQALGAATKGGGAGIAVAAAAVLLAVLGK